MATFDLQLQQQALQPNQKPELQDFHRFIQEKRQRGIVGPKIEPNEINSCFVPEPDLQDYFDDSNRLRRILRAIYPSSGLIPVHGTTIKNHYVKVFAILLCIGKGCYIEHFIRHDSLNDQRLPFDERPHYFPSTGSGDRNFFSSFYDWQWMFCAPTFSYKGQNVWQARRILPILSKEEISGGGSAVTYKIDLHPAYNSLYLIQKSQRSPADPFPNTFVLKTYSSHREEEDYRNEVKAFAYLRNGHTEPSMIGFYGSYVHDGTFNIILEYANQGTLEDYFQKVAPPCTGRDIYHFWRGLLEVIGALRMIHEVVFNDPENPQTFQGWHQDVKPKNILVSTRNGKSIYECEFKLADLGLSHFRAKGGRNARDRDSQGTRTYGAPECYRYDSSIAKGYLHVSPKVDIWSLGCVFSEAAVWLGYGWTGLENFRQQRREETDRIPNFYVPDCFHNGETVLPCVESMHNHLRHDLRASDTITGAVLHLIEGMLYTSKERPEAYYLWKRSRDALQQSEKKLNSGPNGALHSDEPQTLAYPGSTKSLATRSATDCENSVAILSTTSEHARNTWHSVSRTSQSLVTGSSPQHLSSSSFQNPRAVTNLDPRFQGRSILETLPPQTTESPDEFISASDRISPSQMNDHSPTQSKPEDLRLPIFGNPLSLSDEREIEEHDSTSRRSSNNPRNSTRVASQIYKRESPLNGYNQTQVSPVNNVEEADRHQLPNRRTTITSYESRFPTVQSHQDTAPADPQPTPIVYPPIVNIPTGHSNPGNLHLDTPPVDISLIFNPRTGHPPLCEAPHNSYHHAGHLPKETPSNGSCGSGTEAEASRHPFPFLSVEEAFQWREQQKTRLGWSKKSRLLDKQWELELNKRDHVGTHSRSYRNISANVSQVFLIDDSTSMRDHWKEVVKLFTTLAYIVKESDPDGLELCFTCSAGMHNEKHTSRLIDTVKSREPPESPRRLSNIDVGLNSILGNYRNKLRRTQQSTQQSRSLISRSSKDVRKLTLYAFTDGIWQPESDAETPIKYLVNTLDELQMPKEQMGIQFIRFGNDQQGRARLERLDSGLGLNWDIVDTVPSNGDVYKMLLGAINRSFDNVNNASHITDSTRTAGLTELAAPR
ncbi:MAG: hypothetical protein M1816_007179 [Peltula sp. TS41687]|nr:MAG: hypothetical protein M1816_007179 [Peltula sp. TS41687]